MIQSTEAGSFSTKAATTARQQRAARSNTELAMQSRSSIAGNLCEHAPQFTGGGGRFFQDSTLSLRRLIGDLGGQGRRPSRRAQQ